MLGNREQIYAVVMLMIPLFSSQILKQGVQGYIVTRHSMPGCKAGHVNRNNIQLKFFMQFLNNRLNVIIVDRDNRA